MAVARMLHRIFTFICTYLCMNAWCLNDLEVKSTPNCGFEKYPECAPIVCDALPVVANSVCKKDSIIFGEVES
eukprot:5215381-Karenia_brevis.AAC.1